MLTRRFLGLSLAATAAMAGRAARAQTPLTAVDQYQAEGRYLPYYLALKAQFERWLLTTAEPFDDEMRARIAEHQGRRGANWQTIDAPTDLAGAIEDAPADRPVLVDCLTLWLNNLMYRKINIETAIENLEAALAGRAAPTVLVSNEVGFGIVPDNAEARRFRDLQGRLNQRIAAMAGHVILMVAGIPMLVKGEP